MPFLDFEPVPSTVVNGVSDFVVRVPSTVVRGDKMPVPGKTTYKQFPYQARSRSGESWTKDYVFVHAQPGGGSGEPDSPLLWEFYFAPGRPLQNAGKVPVKVKTHFSAKPHPWPNVIQRMGFLEDATQPLSYEIGGQRVNVGRLFGRFWKIPGNAYASKMHVRVYLANEPFPESMIRLNIPVPTVVAWQMRNDSGSIECLHPLIRFKETQVNATVMPDCGTVEHPLLLRETQEFPATNHPTWIPHVCDVDVYEDRGVWVMVEKFVKVPGMKRIKNSA